jgi:hypothetical protein
MPVEDTHAAMQLGQYDRTPSLQRQDDITYNTTRAPQQTGLQSRLRSIDPIHKWLTHKAILYHFRRRSNAQASKPRAHPHQRRPPGGMDHDSYLCPNHLQHDGICDQLSRALVNTLLCRNSLCVTRGCKRLTPRTWRDCLLPAGWLHSSTNGYPTHHRPNMCCI